MDGNSCCFSGHRVIPVEASDILSRRLDVCVDWLYTHKSVTDFYAGGCTGFDTIAEQAVLKYRETHPAARLIIRDSLPESGKRMERKGTNGI